MESAIVAIGTANPVYRQAQSYAAELVSAALHLKPTEKRLLNSIYMHSGIEYRHSVISDYCKQPGQFEFFPNAEGDPFPGTAARMQIYKDNALPLALTAIENCLASLADFEQNKITHLITISCTGMYAPGLDIEIVQRLKLNTTIKRTAINFMGCYGAFNGIKVADSICRADPDATVLMVSVELCTVHFQKNSDITNIVSNAIFADGAAAALIQANTGQQKCLSLEMFYCDLIPQSTEEMAWTIADQGFDIVLSSYVPEIIKSGIAAFTERLFKHSQLSHENIDFYAIHPGGVKILEACEEALNITPEDNRYSYQVMKNYGNMSSATILFVLKAILDELTRDNHQKSIFSCAFGPGLTLESMLLKMQH